MKYLQNHLNSDWLRLKESIKLAYADKEDYERLAEEQAKKLIFLTAALEEVAEVIQDRFGVLPKWPLPGMPNISDK